MANLKYASATKGISSRSKLSAIVLRRKNLVNHPLINRMIQVHISCSFFPDAVCPESSVSFDLPDFSRKTKGDSAGQIGVFKTGNRVYS